MPHLSFRSFVGIHEVGGLRLMQLWQFPLEDVTIGEDPNCWLEDLLRCLSLLKGLDAMQRLKYLGHHVDVHLILWSKVLPAS